MCRKSQVSLRLRIQIQRPVSAVDLIGLIAMFSLSWVYGQQHATEYASARSACLILMTTMLVCYFTQSSTSASPNPHLSSVPYLCHLDLQNHKYLILPYLIPYIPMPEIQSSRISKLYRSTLLRSYALGFIGFIVGIKICDLLMYDPKKHEIEMELMEQQFWKINGQPKYLRGETVESVVRPGTMRTSWIQVVYGKDKYISREQAQE